MLAGISSSRGNLDLSKVVSDTSNGGTNGFTLNGENSSDQSGYSVCSADDDKITITDTDNDGFVEYTNGNAIVEISSGMNWAAGPRVF